VVLADDLGVGDISLYRRMHSDKIVLETPNIDAIAKSGVALFNLADNVTEDESKNLIVDPAQQNRVNSMFKKYNEIRESGI